MKFVSFTYHISTFQPASNDQKGMTIREEFLIFLCLDIQNTLFYIIAGGFGVLMEFCGFHVRDFDMPIFNLEASALPCLKIQKPVKFENVFLYSLYVQNEKNKIKNLNKASEKSYKSFNIF